ncbi:MAG: DUF1553 domain-containing protein [Planctomycetota bacterium]
MFCARHLVAQETPKIDFDREIRPILSDRCYFCHGPDANRREAGLRLDDRDAALAVIEPNEPDESELLRRILSKDADEQMPPPESKLKVTEQERTLIRRWIQQGAEWKKHWAFQKRSRSKPPNVANESSVSNPIDRFILKRLEQEQLTLAPIASKEKLIRRVTFDLTGLPPTLGEIDEFLADDSDDAFEKVVDRLLASSHYGQRMASDWLDVARYSDTYGYQVDRDRFVWPWRDWVIRAFNSNKRYDDFIVEQLAGDLLPNATDGQILATTFNRLHPQKVEGGSVEEEFRVEYVADRAQTMATAFLGLTLECARCHDHKFDPISQKEYYQLFAFFNNIDEAGLYSYFTPAVPTPTLALTDEQQKLELKRLQDAVETMERRWQQEQQELVWSEVVAIAGREPIETVDFGSVGIGRNERTVDDQQRPAVKLTGDDPVNLKTGNFRRFQPFSITISINTPDVKERAVVFHRSRAWTDAASRGYQLLIENGKLSASLIHFWPGNAMRVITTKPIPTNQWIDVAFVYDGSGRASGLSIFVDGQKQKVDVVRDHLTKQITGGGGDKIAVGERFRDRGFTGGQVSAMSVYDRQLSDLEVASLHDQSSHDLLIDSVTSGNLTDDQQATLEQHYRLNGPQDSTERESQIVTADQLREARKKFAEKQDALSEIMVMRELGEPRPAFVLDRGLYDSPKEPVSMETLDALPPMAPTLPRNRLGLAQWLTDPEHPLTARVAVNHYWQLLFGEGLVRTPEDFGRQGALPTHPELLDWLASDFVQHDWDVKRLLKQLVMSSTYRQSSSATSALLKRDPENELWARAPAFRLPAEMLRDNVLSISGLLVDKIGGPPARPYELAASFKPSKPDAGEGLYRRSLYTYWKRTGPAPVMLALDAAKRDVCRVKRERTSSPLQALAMLNGPQFVEASRALAHRLIQQSEADQETIATDLFRMLTSRVPNAAELDVLLTLFKEQHQYFQSRPDETRKYLSVGRFGGLADAQLSWPTNQHNFRLGESSNRSEPFSGKIAQARIIGQVVDQATAKSWFELGHDTVGEPEGPVLIDLHGDQFKRQKVGDVTDWKTFTAGSVVFKKSAKLDPGPEFSVEAWIKPTKISGRVWDKITPGSGDGFLLDLHGGVRFICGNLTVQGTRLPEVNQWSHLLCAVDMRTGGVQMYLNGEPCGSRPPASGALDVDLALLAAWSSVANTLINHDECVTRR